MRFAQMAMSVGVHPRRAPLAKDMLREPDPVERASLTFADLGRLNRREDTSQLDPPERLFRFSYSGGSGRAR